VGKENFVSDHANNSLKSSILKLFNLKPRSG